MRTALRAIFESAIQNGHCRKNPVMSGLRLNSSVPQASKLSWSQTEYDCALQFAKQHPGGLPFLILMETGTANPNKEHYEIQRSSGKNIYRHRTIPILSELCELLSAYVQTHPSSLLFTNRKGKAKDLNNWYHREYKKFMNELCAATGCRYLTTHELRHTRASLLVQNNVNLFAVAKLLGHSDLNMLSKRHLHAAVEELRESLNLI